MMPFCSLSGYWGSGDKCETSNLVPEDQVKVIVCKEVQVIGILLTTDVLDVGYPTSRETA